MVGNGPLCVCKGTRRYNCTIITRGSLQQKAVSASDRLYRSKIASQCNWLFCLCWWSKVWWTRCQQLLALHVAAKTHLSWKACCYQRSGWARSTISLPRPALRGVPKAARSRNRGTHPDEMKISEHETETVFRATEGSVLLLSPTSSAGHGELHCASVSRCTGRHCLVTIKLSLDKFNSPALAREAAGQGTSTLPQPLQGHNVTASHTWESLLWSMQTHATLQPEYLKQYFPLQKAFPHDFKSTF